MNHYAIALFVHIVGALGLVVALGLEWTSLLLLRRATTSEQARERMGLASGVRRVSGASLATLLISGSHAIYVSQPDAVAALIEMAANEIAAPAN